MLRLITSRWVRFALAAAAVAAIVVTVVRLRRRPVRQDPAISVVVSGGEAGEAESVPEPRWPPVPMLGVPTDDDLRRYDGGGPSALERFFEDLPPRVPLDEAVRSRLARWGVVGIGLCLLFFGTQVLETTAFSSETETVEETTAFVGSASWGPISPEDGSCSVNTNGVLGPSVDCLTETEQEPGWAEGGSPGLLTRRFVRPGRPEPRGDDGSGAGRRARSASRLRTRTAGRRSGRRGREPSARG